MRLGPLGNSWGYFVAEQKCQLANILVYTVLPHENVPKALAIAAQP